MKFARPINTKGLPARITQAFIPGKHLGIDYGYPKGTPVYASESGRIVICNNKETRSWRTNTQNDPYRRADGTARPLITADYGQLVKIQHLEGYQTMYAHLSKVVVVINQEVKKGEKIGEVGATGNTGGGNHLHHELRKVYWGIRTVWLNLAQYLDSGFTNYR